MHALTYKQQAEAKALQNKLAQARYDLANTETWAEQRLNVGATFLRRLDEKVTKAERALRDRIEDREAGRAQVAAEREKVAPTLQPSLDRARALVKAAESEIRAFAERVTESQTP